MPPFDRQRRGAPQSPPQGPTYPGASSSRYSPPAYTPQGAPLGVPPGGPLSYSYPPSGSSGAPQYPSGGAPSFGGPHAEALRYGAPSGFPQQQQYMQQQLLLEPQQQQQQQQQQQPGSEIERLQQQCRESLRSSIKIVGETTQTSQATAEQLAEQSGQNPKPLTLNPKP